ncbi:MULTISPECIES: PaaI family thioesterase [unclassified Beijerinckia]|uniref:PaaI family thioesterase n=1 Tax=unclassified Beijerinckia TaxID=2638183 RepID=UPI00089A35E0|nr:MULTISPECIES: PaaI family thioesterase [unclassified Beijerinckia]MDH7796299.1 uncharacterized protein (TIGR00369 family) [Beijerinckia sp. GAS462]SEC38997.1 uncharacterized domain 1-containing protein [Beijerinckia sp. 28-YEA-48]
MDDHTRLPAFHFDRTKSGLEVAQSWIEQGYVSGFSGALRVKPVWAERGAARFTCAVESRHSNFVGLVHGGVAAALVDMAAGTAAMTLIAPGETILTVDLSVRYLNPAPLDVEELIAHAIVSYHDRRKAICDVKVTDPKGHLIVLGGAHIALRPAAKAKP